jgi:hypothetical protein
MNKKQTAVDYLVEQLIPKADLHFCTGPGEQKSKNIEGNPQCCLTTGSDHFRSGLDTVDIAALMNVSEAVVSRRIYEQRCHERGLTLNYERHVRQSVPAQGVRR